MTSLSHTSGHPRSTELQVFISHTEAHSQQAAAIADGLEQFHLSAFAARRDIRDMENWKSRLQPELATMDALIALISSDFEHHHWPNQEIGIALGRDVPVLPVDYGAIPCGFISHLNAISFSGSVEELVVRLFEALLGRTEDKNVETKATDCLISAICSADSYMAAGGLAKMLQHVKHMSPAQTEQLVSACQENDQVRLSHLFWKHGEQDIERLTDISKPTRRQP